MSQNVVVFSDDPSGDQLLDDKLTPLKANIESGHSGSGRPSYAQAGLIFTDTTNPALYIVKGYDGSGDALMGQIDPATHLHVPYSNGIPLSFTGGSYSFQATLLGNTALTFPVSGTVATTANLSNPNLFENGNFEIWQRGTSFTPSLSTFTYTADRFITYATGASGAVTRQTGETAQGNQYCLQIAGIASNTATSIARRVESTVAQRLVGGAIRMRFRINSSTNISANTINWTISSFNVADVSGAKTSRHTGTIAPAINSGWNEIEIPVANLDANCANGFEILIAFGARTTGTLQIGRHKLEKSAVSTDYSFAPLASELVSCMRYYQRMQSAAGGIFSAGQMLSASSAFWGFRLPVTMRTTPAVSFVYGRSSGAGFTNLVNNANVNTGPLSATPGSPDDITIVAAASASATAGYPSILRSSDVNDKIIMDAEI